jgi:hypothetical protein
MPCKLQLIALCLLSLTLGCGPSEFDKAAIYMAAKTELDEAEKQASACEELYAQAIATSDPEIAKHKEQAKKQLDEWRADIVKLQKVVDANRPSN